ncbi:alpha/beta fold hydrolase [Nocardia yunnanensis]|uniref:alpha/beta fold hydrolase n=1 Tax=Nocardia yunnanensis TaxID=2382165 RepID=UPI001CA44CEA|nr:alpha/beta hydrolase [Nocardia yunnanensis]
MLTALVNGTALAPDSPEARNAEMIARIGTAPEVMLGVLDSLLPTPESALRAITVPTLIAIGDQDERADADQLATLLPNSRFTRVPGDHGTAFAAPEFTAAILDFLAAP